MSIGRKVGYVAVVLAVFTFCGYTAFIMITQSARDSATELITKPLVVELWERAVANAPVPGAPAPHAGGVVIPQEKRYAAYAELAKRMRSIRRSELLALSHTPADVRTRLHEILAKYPDIFDQIRKTIELGGPTAPLDLSESGIGSRGSLAGPLRDCGLLLNAYAADCADRGEMDTAIENLQLALSLAELMSTEPLPDSLQCSQRVYGWSLETLQTIVADNGIDPEFGAQMVERLATASHRDALRDALETEAYLTNRYYEDFANLGTREFMLRHMEGDAGEVGTTAVVWLAQSPLGQPWANINAAATAENARRLQQWCDRPYYESLPEAVALLNEAQGGLLYYRMPADVFTNSQVSALAEQAVHETRVDIARTGIALELFYSDHGNYPEMLDDLAPYLGGEIPIDPLSGERFFYSTVGTGYELIRTGGNRLQRLAEILYFPFDIHWEGRHKSAPTTTVAAAQ